MKLLGNLLWVILGGLFMSIGYALVGLIFCFTIIGIPFGIQLFKMARLALWPFNKVVSPKHENIGCLASGMNLLWLSPMGLIIAWEHAFIGLFFYITIIGYPFGKQHFKLASIALTPFGHTIKTKREEGEDDEVEELNGEATMKNDFSEDSEQEPSSFAERLTDFTDDDEEVDEKKKWYYIGGGLLTATLVALGLWLTFSRCNENNPLGLIKPSWEKFVIVTSSEVPLFKEAKSDSPKLMEAIENLDSDVAAREFRWEDNGKKRGYTLCPFYLEKNSVLPVLEETETWYKVQVRSDLSCAIEHGFIMKDCCKETIPRPITEEVLAHVGKTMQRIDHIVKKGDLKNLCLSTQFSDLDGISFQVGSLVDGVLIYPNSKRIFLKKEGISQINLQYNDRYDNYTLLYGEDHQTNLDEYSQVFDPRKLADEMVKQIFEATNEVDLSAPMESEYYFPEANKDFFFKFVYFGSNNTTNKASSQNVTEETKVTGYHEGYRGDEKILLAEFGSASDETGVVYWGPLIEVTDLDGDGNMDALIQDGLPGNSGIYSFSVVYYDETSDKFNTTEDNIYTMSDSPEIVEWNNRKCIVVNDGIRIDRFAFEDHFLKNVSTEKGDIGATLIKIPIDRVFDMTVQNAEVEEREVSADINGDGVNETLVFSNGDYAAYGYGDYMLLERIKWADGSLTDGFGALYSGDTFAFLQNETNGLPDILVRDQYLFRWNGSIYERWNWNGTLFEKTN